VSSYVLNWRQSVTGITPHAFDQSPLSWDAEIDYHSALLLQSRDPMFPPDLTARAAGLISRYRAAGLLAATAESCTGGLIAGLLTEIPSA
jgi:hypothetical protein